MYLSRRQIPSSTMPPDFVFSASPSLSVLALEFIISRLFSACMSRYPSLPINPIKLFIFRLRIFLAHSFPSFLALLYLPCPPFRPLLLHKLSKYIEHVVQGCLQNPSPIALRIVENPLRRARLDGFPFRLSISLDRCSNSTDL